MKALYSTEVATPHGKKTVSVIVGNVLEINERIDVLTASAFVGDYTPMRGTLFGALYGAGIDVRALAREPYLDLRGKCDVWLSDEIPDTGVGIRRIGCVELVPCFGEPALDSPILAIKAYFSMLDLAGISGVNISTVALPLLGGGDQGISASLTLIPIINECISFLRRNEACERILFIDVNEVRAEAFAAALSGMYSLLASPDGQASEKKEYTAFISYSSKDRNVADNLCNKLESRGIKVWYAPRNVAGAYASAIMKGIREATHFIVIVSSNSLASQHVLNEIDNAHSRLPELKFKPLRIDDMELTPEFSYYLSRQHWMDATHPPLEARLDSFVDAIIADL